MKGKIRSFDLSVKDFEFSPVETEKNYFSDS